MGGIFSDFYDEGLNKGIAQGVSQVCEEGQSSGRAEVIRKLLDAKLLTVNQIADLLKISVEEVQNIVEKAPVFN